MKLYYYTAAQWAYDDIANEHIKISRLGAVNDPNEWTPIFYDPVTQETVPVSVARRFVIEHWSDAQGCVSLSKSWNIAPMWGLYADKYQGVVLELEILREDLLFEVDYVAERPRCSTIGSEGDLKKIVAKKSKAWGFEQEVRYLHSLDVNACQYFNGVCFAPMQVITPGRACNIRLAKIIFGPMMNQSWRKQFMQLCMEYENIPMYGRKIRYVEAKFDDNSYYLRMTN